MYRFHDHSFARKMKIGTCNSFAFLIISPGVGILNWSHTSPSVPWISSWIHCSKVPFPVIVGSSFLFSFFSFFEMVSSSGQFVSDLSELNLIWDRFLQTLNKIKYLSLQFLLFDYTSLLEIDAVGYFNRTHSNLNSNYGITTTNLLKIAIVTL